MFTQAVNNGVPSKLGKWKIFNNAGDELTEVKAVHLDNPPQVSSGIKIIFEKIVVWPPYNILINFVFSRQISNGLKKKSQVLKAGFTCTAQKQTQPILGLIIFSGEKTTMLICSPVGWVASDSGFF